MIKEKHMAFSATFPRAVRDPCVANEYGCSDDQIRRGSVGAF
jgi:hypothetical protein